MSAILAAIGSKVVIAILSAIAGWVAKYIHGVITNVKEDKQAVQDAQSSVDPLKKAGETDAKAIDDSSGPALGGL
jgi:hypothetical protein